MKFGTSLLLLSCLPGNNPRQLFDCSGIHKRLRKTACTGLLLFLSFSLLAQQPPSREVRAKLMEIYKKAINPEISFEKFVRDNTHVFAPQSDARAANPGAALAVAPSVFCSNVRSYCANGDFESGLDQTQYTGAYGTWIGSGNANLYPDPFSLTNGFASGIISSSAAHQTIVNKAAGNDVITGISVVPSNGGSQSLRLGNTATSYGTELIAKTVVVDPSETILNFYYAVVLQDPGHPFADQPAFSVRAYDCATGLELPNVCNLGNGTNIAVSDAQNPFFKSLNSPTWGTIAYRDWSVAQINLSAYVGKTVIVVFTNKDCGQGAHWGYTYLDNLFSGQCPVAPPGTTTQGSIVLNTSKLDSCGNGQICTKYSLPYIVNGSVITTGDITISLNVYQNNTLVKTVTSAKITAYGADSSYCFSIDPSALGINTALGGFDYSITGAYTLSGFALSPTIVGNPPSGQKPGTNNDYLVTCTNGCNLHAATSVTNETNAGANGAVTISASGGTAPYAYVLNAVSSTTGVYTGLSAGSYAFTVTDAGNCTVHGTVNITNIVPGNGSTACPADSTITADPTTCKAIINWTAPSALYPDSIPLAGTSSALRYKGAYNGHGYYQSDDSYFWTDAKNAAAGVNGHLVTITDAGESNFIKTNLPQPDFGAWIGLYNTGTEGSFAWVNGEPFSYTDWNYTEPNNSGGSPGTIAEPYVHIRGVAPNDRWNDISGLFSLNFVAEYDDAVLTYVQTSGPAPGSSVAPGVYNICYEITNHAIGTKTTCCFKITVVCNSSSSACPKDTTISTNSGDCTTTVKWTPPSMGYPDSIAVAGGTTANGWLRYKGMYNGHGYYQSDDSYSWPGAKAAAGAVNSHLVTITDAGESNFIKTNLPQPDFGAWIGLYNTGTEGSFAWDNGEPFSYTDWNYTEPNNSGGSPGNIAEQYVHIRGVAPNDRWNDISGLFSLNFIAEYDKPVLTYTQISGIPWGSTQGPGTYTICYEITNTVTGQKSTCCFNVKVVCNQAAARIGGTPAANVLSAAGVKELSAVAYPNPAQARTAFSIRAASNEMNERISIQVIDVMGRVVETKMNVQPNSTVTMGSGYRPGLYMIQVMQGKKTVMLRMVKQ